MFQIEDFKRELQRRERLDRVPIKNEMPDQLKAGSLKTDPAISKQDHFNERRSKCQI